MFCPATVTNVAAVSALTLARSKARSGTLAAKSVDIVSALVSP